MKQIKLKDRTIKIIGCKRCPFWVVGRLGSLCRAGSNVFYPHRYCPEDCPLDDYTEEYV